MIDDRPMGKLSFRSWLVQMALITLSSPQNGQMLIRIAVRERVGLPQIIHREAEAMADRVERALLLGATGLENDLTARALRLWQAYDRYASH
jgi:hypothetical protein